MLKAKIWIVEEMPTFVFDANNNLDLFIFLHNTNNRKKIKKSSFCLILLLSRITKRDKIFRIQHWLSKLIKDSNITLLQKNVIFEYLL